MTSADLQAEAAQAKAETARFEALTNQAETTGRVFDYDQLPRRQGVRMSKTMAEEIMLHSPIGRDEKGQYCKACNHRYGYAADRTLHQRASAHIAAALSAAGFGFVADAKAPEVRYATLTNGETELDEVVATNATVHLEAMDDNHWWLLVESGGETVHVNFYTKRAKIRGHAETDS